MAGPRMRPGRRGPGGPGAPSKQPRVAAAAAPVPSSNARALAQALQERIPAAVLELDLDYCNNTFGVAPCAAGRKDSGTAQAAGASTITLRAAASAVDSFYKGMTVRVTGGTGAGQEGKISAYVGATKVATLSAPWAVLPDVTSTYDVIDRANGCYNVFAGQSPCQNLPNFSRGTKTIKFCSSGMPIPPGEQIRPYLGKTAFTPTAIDTTKGLAPRSVTSLTLADEPARDDLDKYVGDRAVPAAGTYWPRLIARNPNAIGRIARLRKGYVVSPWDWNTFQTELYVINAIAGPDAQGKVTVQLADAVKLLDRVKLPPATDGTLISDMLAVSSSGSVAAATSTTVQLAVGASAVDGAYNGQEIFITGGLGVNQRRVISAYVGLTRTATVPAWATIPDVTSLYEVAPISFNVGVGKGAQYNDPVATLKNEYVRIGDEVIRYASKAGDVLNLADGTYRAQFGTARADHKINAGVQQCLAWINTPATSVVRDILNFGGLGAAYLDLAQLAADEANWYGAGAAITACISDAGTTGSALLAELLQDLNMMAWWHPVEQKVKFKANMPELGAVSRTLTDDNLVLASSGAERLDTERLTRASLDFNLASATADRKKRTNFLSIQIFIDSIAESPNGYGDQRVDARQSRWMSAANAAFAGNVVKRRLLAVRDAPVKLAFKLDPRDEISLGTLVDVTTRKQVDAAGNPLVVRHRIMKVVDNGESIDIETRSTTFGQRYAFICPNGYPDYPAANADQRRRAFIAVTGTSLMSDGEPAYLII